VVIKRLDTKKKERPNYSQQSFNVRVKSVASLVSWKPHPTHEMPQITSPNGTIMCYLESECILELAESFQDHAPIVRNASQALDSVPGSNKTFTL
jgi:hypothetical protein